MKHTTLIFLLIIWLCSISSNANAASPPLQCKLPNSSIFKQIKAIKVHQFVLQNGLRLLVIPDHQSPFFTMRLVYAAGSRDETNGQSGYAHLVEHLMFKGSAHIKDGAFMSAIEFAGGSANASTDYDRTDFWAQLPKNYLQRALWMEADRMQQLVLTKQSIDNQRQAVKEEKALRLTNQPYLNIASHFIIKQWKNTPYGHLLIGSDKDLNQADKQKMESWLAAYYHPSNSVLAITGDVDPDTVFSLVKKYFAHIPAGKKRQEITDRAVVQQKIQQTLYDPMAPWPVHALGWQTPGFAHKDSTAIRVVNDLLFQKPDGILYRELLEKQKLAIAVEHLDYGFQYIALANAIIVPHSYASNSRIKKTLDRALVKLQQRGFSSQQLCRMVKTRITSTVSSYQRPLSLVTLLSDDLIVQNDIFYRVKQMQNLLHFDVSQANKILQHYYSESYLFITIEPGWFTRMIKTLTEWMPDSFGQYFEEKFL